MGNRLEIPVRTKGSMKQISPGDINMDKHAKRLARLQAEVKAPILKEPGIKKENLVADQAVVNWEKMKELMDSKYKSQREFEKANKVYNATINHIKKGKPIRIHPTLIRIAEGLDIDTDDLILIQGPKG